MGSVGTYVLQRTRDRAPSQAYVVALNEKKNALVAQALSAALPHLQQPEVVGVTGLTQEQAFNNTPSHHRGVYLRGRVLGGEVLFGEHVLSSAERVLWDAERVLGERRTRSLRRTRFLVRRTRSVGRKTRSDLQNLSSKKQALSAR